MLLLESVTPTLVADPRPLRHVLLLQPELPGLPGRHGARRLHRHLAAEAGVGTGLHCK